MQIYVYEGEVGEIQFEQVEGPDHEVAARVSGNVPSGNTTLQVAGSDYFQDIT
jgi:hypothetical protein